MKIVGKVLIYILLFLVLAIVVIGIYTWINWDSWVTASFPQQDGQIQLPGLLAPVEVFRDELGVVHIYAENEHDLFMAQGFIHAQDRFWQMDFQRLTSAGRLSEMVGGSGLETDQFLRTLGWEQTAMSELEMMPPKTVELLEYYAEGVNAYIMDKETVELGLEYVFINLLSPGYEPKPWEPVNTVTWVKLMAWDLRGNMDDEIRRSIFLTTMTPEQIAELFPPYPEDKPIIISGFGDFESGSDLVPLPSALEPALQQVSDIFNTVDDELNVGYHDGIGSNSWVVSGELTSSGYPLLANDMHLSASIPFIWYENGLHCLEVSEECPWNVAGVSFVGSPGVVVGHNDNIAWAYTNVGPDVMDLFIEKINPDNPNQYEYMGEWVDMEIVTETLNIGTKDSEELVIRITRHGPIISDVYGDFENYDEESGVDLPENYAIALRWTALEENFTVQAILDINLAENWDDFRAAAMNFTVPAQNLLYADVNGNIGYQMPGSIPIRAGDSDGKYPVPGWTGEHEWLGYVPFEELPFTYNPESGYIVTANNAIVGSDYPYQIADSFAYGYRAQSIVNLIKSAPGPIDVEYFQQMHGDNYNIGAEEMMPYLLSVDFTDSDLQEQQGWLAEWDLREEMGSPQAAFYNIFFKNLLILTFDEIPEDDLPGGGGHWYEVMRTLIQNPDSAWWDRLDTDDLEMRDEIVEMAFKDALKEAKSLMGSDRQGWAWGDIHTLTYEHQVMSSLPLVNKAFERGPFETAGGSSTINNTWWMASSEGYFVEGPMPSERLIVDLSDLASTLLIHPAGQSGHPYHENYIDMAKMWVNIEYNLLGWEYEQVRGDASHTLTLVP